MAHTLKVRRVGNRADASWSRNRRDSLLASPASPLRSDITKAFNRITDTISPGAITVPTVAVGGSAGRYLTVAGIPTYGVQGFFQDRDDDAAEGAHLERGVPY